MNQPPRVALDASFLDLPPSGTRTYVEQLVHLYARDSGRVSPWIIAPGRTLDPREPHDEAIRSWPARSRSRRQRFAWDALGVARACRDVKAELLHIPHFSAPVHSTIPIVVTVHDLIPLIWPAYRRSLAMRVNLAAVSRTVRRAARVICPSHSAKREIELMLGILTERIDVIPMAVSRRFRPAPMGGHPAILDRLGIKGPYLFNVGGFDLRKNLPALIEAFARARSTLDPETLLVIGGAPHSGNNMVFLPLDPIIRRLGLGRQVVLTGRLTDDETVALHQYAQMYVTTSLHEGFGLTALEAMACGVPVIASNLTSLPEVVGDAGLLVEPLPEAVAASIIAVASDPALATRLSERGIERAATFSWERTAQRTVETYRQVLDS
jgi:glycosyltransferase involved in cell wall biosynthesis